MKNDRLNVLSIDWDYFIDADIETRVNYFPDGNDNLGPMLQTIVWSSRYSQKELSDVKVDYASSRRVRRLLEDADYWESCMIADSHKHAYDFILENYDKSRYDGVNLVDIDFHHDIYSNGSDVDCGNWLRKLMEEPIFKGNSQFTWISREDSDFPESSECGTNTLQRVTDLDILEEYEWDIIYICRSAMWSPPHLDKQFKKTFKGIMDKGLKVVYERDIFTTRFTEDLKRSIAMDAKTRRDYEMVMALNNR